MSNFIELCLLGNLLMEEIDDYVDAWHETPAGVSLPEFLGMTQSEYNLWVVDPDVLPTILEAHRTGEDVASLIDSFNPLPMAARAASSETARQLAAWLKEKGLWN